MEQSNLTLQREAALEFRDRWPAVEKIRFTSEGGGAGLGASWGANAVVTVHGNDHQVIIGPGRAWIFQTNGVPPDSPGPAVHPLTIVFSDGNSEVIR